MKLTGKSCSIAVLSIVILVNSLIDIACATSNQGEPVEQQPAKTDPGITEAMIPGEITGLSLSNETVILGDQVTVTVEGKHTCMSWVGTSGADGSTGLSELFSEQKPLPHYYTFTASKTGTFGVAVLGMRPDKKGCIDKPGGVISTSLTILSPDEAYKKKIEKKLTEKPIPGPDPVTPEGLKAIFGGDVKFSIRKSTKGAPSGKGIQQLDIDSTGPVTIPDASQLPPEKINLPDLVANINLIVANIYSEEEKGVTCFTVYPSFNYSNIGQGAAKGFNYELEWNLGTKSGWQNLSVSSPINEALVPGETRTIHGGAASGLTWCTDETEWKPAWRIILDPGGPIGKVLELKEDNNEAVAYFQPPGDAYSKKLEKSLTGKPIPEPGSGEPKTAGKGIQQLKVDSSGPATMPDAGQLPPEKIKLPDLVATAKIVKVKSEVIDGVTCYTTRPSFTYSNIGQSAAKGFRYKLEWNLGKTNGWQIYSYPDPVKTALVPGETRTIDSTGASWYVSWCTNETKWKPAWRITVDPDGPVGKVLEMKEDNNQAIAYFSPGRVPVKKMQIVQTKDDRSRADPNLTIAHARAVCNSKLKTFEITVSPRNTGFAPASEFLMDVSIDGKLVRTFKYEELEPQTTGQTKRISYRIGRESTDGAWIQAEINGQKNNETNVNDNSRRLWVTCRNIESQPLSPIDKLNAKPKLRINLSSRDGSSSLKAGDKATVKVTVTNVGNMASSAEEYSLHCKPQNCPFRKTRGKLKTLEPNKSQSFVLTSQSLSPGQYEIVMKTDYGKSNILSLNVTQKPSRESSTGRSRNQTDDSPFRGTSSDRRER